MILPGSYLKCSNCTLSVHNLCIDGGFLIIIEKNKIKYKCIIKKNEITKNEIFLENEVPY